MLFNTSPLFVPHQAVHATIDQSLEEPLPLLSRNKRGVAFGEKTWPQHAVLNIALLNMTNDQKDLVKHNINQWAPYTNLYFKFTDGPHGDLRITADNNASSGWSKVGTDAKYVPLAKPTERNTHLPEGDKRFVRALYPADNSPLGKLLDTAIRAMVNTQTT